MTRSGVSLTALLVVTAPWSGGQDDKQVLRDLGPDKTLSVCAFNLSGANSRKNMAKTLGGWLIGGVIAHGIDATPYSQKLTEDFRGTFESALAATGAFQLVSAEHLMDAQNGKPLPLDDAAKANALFACVSAESKLSVAAGFRKRVKVVTRWELVGPSGWKIPVSTDVTSEETTGTFVNTADPTLRPVFVGLARDSVRQFLEKLDEMMTKAGSPTHITIVIPDDPLEPLVEAAVEPVMDPGSLPRPEPDSALNADGKWEKHVTLHGGVDLALIYIPEGGFSMGSAQWVDDEESWPQHGVAIDRAYWIGKYEVTQAQWQAVMGTNPSEFKGDDLPVDSVSWNDARTFLDRLNRHLGLDGERAFRLPAEAEWEYACRAGTTTIYSFGDSPANLAEYAWFEENSSDTTHPVGQLRPNHWGVYDMYGNVAEWCEDGWHSGYEGAPVDGRAWPSDESDRVCRGGAWDQSPEDLQSHIRRDGGTTDRDETVGFRLVLPVWAPSRFPSR